MSEPAAAPRVLYLSHGGGPLPLLGDPAHAQMVSTLREIAADIPTPDAILVVSAHWEAEHPTLTHALAPPLLYDYYGFPDEAYEITYPAFGVPKLAEAVRECLNADGFEAILDDDRGFDHGLFVPLKIMYPDAAIPCVQLSLKKGLDPAEHIRMGAALSRLAFPGLLIIGSGFSFHNMRAFFSPSEAREEKNGAFQTWLSKTCSDASLIESERRERLIRWENAPYARYCHPREEHLLPLHVCYGAAGRACDRVYRPQILGVASSMFLWQSRRG